jgi:hypothetical protein
MYPKERRKSTKTSVNFFDIPAEIRSTHLLNTSPGRYRYVSPFSHNISMRYKFLSPRKKIWQKEIEQELQLTCKYVSYYSLHLPCFSNWSKQGHHKLVWLQYTYFENAVPFILLASFALKFIYCNHIAIISHANPLLQANNTRDITLYRDT